MTSIPIYFTSSLLFLLFLCFHQKCTSRLSISKIKMSSSLQSAFLSANRGPLTKIFTPRASCLDETTLVSYLTTISSLTTSYTTTKIFINHYSWGDGACYPSTIATISGSTRWNNGYYYCESIRQRGGGLKARTDETLQHRGYVQVDGRLHVRHKRMLLDFRPRLGVRRVR